VIVSHLHAIQHLPKKGKTMQRVLATFCLIAIFFLVVGCQPSAPKEDLAVKTSTDYFAEAAQRMAEKSDFRYNNNGYKKSSDISYRFDYPQSWSIPASMQMPALDVLAMRNEPINDFSPNFNVVVFPQSDPNILKARKSQFRREMRKELPDLEVIDFEHGKFKDNDIVYVHSQSTIEGIEVEQYQYLFNFNNKGLVLTFSSSCPTPESVKEEFDAILATFKVGTDANAE